MSLRGWSARHIRPRPGAPRATRRFTRVHPHHVPHRCARADGDRRRRRMLEQRVEPVCFGGRDERPRIRRPGVRRPRRLRRPDPDAAERERHAPGRRRHVPGPALPVLVRDVQRPVPQREDRLPGRGLGRRHQGHHPADRRLRRDRRSDDGHGDRGAARPARRSCTSRRRSAPSWSSSTCRGSTTLNLDAQNIADIFLGNIKTWNDPKIAANNPGVTLPEHADPRRSPVGRLWHDEHVHVVPRGRQP